MIGNNNSNILDYNIVNSRTNNMQVFTLNEFLVTEISIGL